MFFLLRMAFWLGLVLILLPSGGAHRNQQTSEVNTSDAISAASATVHDLKGFCGREPNACAVGSQLAAAIGYRAQAGARMLYEMLSDALATHDGPLPAAGDVPAQMPPSVQPASENTLTPTDLAPAWRGPASRKSKPSA